MYNDLFFGTGMMHQMLAHIDASQKQRIRQEAGITEINGFEGIERLNIPHKYDRVQIGVDQYFFCTLNDTVSVYDSTGKFLFECNKLVYYGQGMFFVGRKKAVTIIGKERADEFGYALYHNETKLTEPIFRPHGMSKKFNEFGFSIANLFGRYNSVVINKSGEILLEVDSWDTPYLHGVVCSDKNISINLLSGNVICKKGYDTIYTDEFLFIKTDSNCVYQITKATGEFTVHGELKVEEPKEPAKPIEYPIIKNAEPAKKIGRNELCPECEKEGTKMKFKKCKKHNG